MNRITWIRTGLCLLTVLALLCTGLALAEGNTGSGELLSPAVELGADSVVRGELLEVHASGWDERAEWRYAKLYNEAEEELFSTDVWSDDFCMPTAQLGAGSSYLLRVGCGATDCIDGTADRWFTVTGSDADFAADEVYWAFSAEEFETIQAVYFSVYSTYPDVSYTRVEAIRRDSYEWYDEWYGGDCVLGQFNTDRDGVYDFNAYLYREGEDEPFARSSFTVNVTADGDLASTRVNMPRSITMLQPLSGTIEPVEGAERYTVFFAINRDDEWEIFERHGQDADDLTIDYDGHWFDEPGVYRMIVAAHAQGKNSSYTEYYLSVLPQEGERVTLTVGGEHDDVFCSANALLPVVVNAPGASALEYFDGRHWRNVEYWRSSVGYTGSLRFDGGDTTVWVRAWFEELGEWRCSNPVTVHAEILGEVEDIELTLSAQEVTRGEALEATFTAAQSATQYDLRIQDLNYNEYFCFTVAPGTYSLPTMMLEPGEYCVTVDWRGIGCEWRHIEQMFTVTGGDAPVGITTRLSASEAACNEDVILSVYAPGAEMIRIYNEENSNADEWFDERGGETYIQNHSWAHPEYLFFTVSACYNGEWSERVEIGGLNVIDSPQLSTSERMQCPTLISEGEDVVFSFPNVENAASYGFDLMDNDVLNESNWIMGGSFNAPETVTLPASLFRAGHTYRIDIHVSAPGYETYDASYSLAVRPALVDGDITLSVNGETEAVEGLVSKRFHVVAEAPENATAIIVSDGLGWDWQPGNHFESDFYYDFGGEVSLIARYTTDEIDDEAAWWEQAGWSGYSNPVTLSIRSNGRMPQVEAEVPESAVRGDWMTIPITNAETFLNGEYENLWLHAQPYFPDEDIWYDSVDWDGSGTIVLPTANLEDGRTYQLHVRAGADGWVGSINVYDFSVTAPESGDIRFEISKTNVVACENFTISVFAPGAEQVKIFRNSSEMDCRDGAAYVQQHNRGDVGQHHFHAEAYYAETDEWVRTETVTVTVTAPNGELTAEEVNLRMPTHLNAGEPLTIAWDDFGMYHYDVRINRVRDGQCVWHSWNDHGETEMTVPVVMPAYLSNADQVVEPGTAILEAGEFYTVNLDFQRWGSSSRHYERQIVVDHDDMYAEGLTLSVQGGTEDFSIGVNTGVPVTITAPEGATAILAWNGDNWAWYEGSRVETRWAWGDDNTRLLYARYTTDEIVEGKDWPEYGWSRISNIVTVQLLAKGRMPQVEAEVPESAVRGDWMTIPITNAETFLNGEYENLWLHAQPYFPDEDIWYDSVDWDGSGTIVLPTANLEDGRTYQLHVRAGADGWVGSTNVYDFSVTAPESGDIRFEISKSAAETCESYAISVFAPGADEVRIYRDHYEIDRCGGDSCVLSRWDGDAGEHLLYARVHDPETDKWVQTASESLTVTAPNGVLTAEEVNLQMPACLNAGEPLTFSWDDIGLYHINADVYRVSDGKRVWHSWNNQGVTEMSVPVVMPEQNDSMEQVLDVGEIVLEADETYEVNIGFYRRGNDMLHVRKYVLVTEDAEPDAAITLTVNGSISDASSLVNEDIPMTVEAPENAAAIIVWNGEFWAWFDGSRADFAWGWGSTGERMLFAKYTTDENAREDGDWNSYEWSAPSNIVTVSVSKNGNTEAPRVSLSSNSPVRGETLTFTVENAEENGGYHWTVYDTVDDWNWEWRDWEDSATHEIDTYELQSNRTYLLWVYNYGFVGVESDGVKIPFTVTANGTAPAPEVEAADSVAKGDALFIRIKNPDAGDCFRAWFWQEDSGTHDAVEWDGTDTIVLPTHDLTVGAYTELYIENVGSFGVEQSCISMPIAVTEPSGELSLYVERTELVTQQMTRIVAFAAGSEKIDLYACHAEKPDEPFWYESTEEDVLDGYWNFTGHAGAKILTAVATYSDGTTQTLTVNVTVTAPEGNLPEPTIENVPDILTYGQELAFHVNAHNAEWWFVEVSDMTEEGRLMHHWDMQSEDGDFKLEADELVEGHTYGISAYVARYAWEEAGSYKEFTVVQGDDPYAEHVLVLPEALTVIEEEAFEGVAAITVVIPDGAVSIGSRAFADCPSLKYVEIPASVTGIADDAFAGSSVIFICGFDSFAYQYAQEHGIPVR